MCQGFGSVLRRAVPWERVRAMAGRAPKWAGVALAVVLVAAGGWFGYTNYPKAVDAWGQVRAMWSHWVAEATLWAEFIASVLLSVIALSWMTALLFGALGATAYLLPHLVHLACSIFTGNTRLPRIRDAIQRTRERHDRLLGTALNLLASAGALWAFTRVTRRPLDHWDLGIQAAIALMIELIVLGAILRGAREA